MGRKISPNIVSKESIKKTTKLSFHRKVLARFREKKLYVSQIAKELKVSGDQVREVLWSRWRRRISLDEACLLERYLVEGSSLQEACHKAGVDECLVNELWARTYLVYAGGSRYKRQRKPVVIPPEVIKDFRNGVRFIDIRERQSVSVHTMLTYRHLFSTEDRKVRRVSRLFLSNSKQPKAGVQTRQQIALIKSLLEGKTLKKAGEVMGVTRQRAEQLKAVLVELGIYNPDFLRESAVKVEQALLRCNKHKPKKTS